MLQKRDAQIVNLLKKRIEAAATIRQMVVFGSRARGDAGLDSDLDVFIELPELTPGLRQRILDLAWEISLEQEVVISVFLASSWMLTNSPLAGNPLLRSIQTEGIAV